MFFYLEHLLNQREVHDINYLVNPQTFNGEVMLNLAIQHLPAKVNFELYNRIKSEQMKQKMMRTYMLNGQAHVYQDQTAGAKPVETASQAFKFGNEDRA